MKLTTKISRRLTETMNNIADFIGRPLVFAASVVAIIIWFVLRQFIEYETWFDIMDVTIFLVTFLLLFVLQASQNADTQAIQDKLDEIIDNLPGASTSKEREEELLKKGHKIKR